MLGFRRRLLSELTNAIKQLKQQDDQDKAEIREGLRRGAPRRVAPRGDGPQGSDAETVRKGPSPQSARRTCLLGEAADRHLLCRAGRRQIKELISATRRAPCSKARLVALQPTLCTDSTHLIWRL